MSLINDALKRSQRERSAQKPGVGGEPLLDGFFPYVSTATPRQRSKLVPIVGVSALGVALLAFGAWMVFAPADRSPAPRPAGLTIPPPPLKVAQTPPADSMATDSAVTAVTADNAANAADAEPDVASGSSTARRPESREVASVPRTAPTRGASARAVDSSSGRAEPELRRIVEAASATPRVETSPGRVDYEAQAILAFNAGDLELAREKFLLATRHAPTARAWTNYGVTLQKLGDLAGAGRAYQAAIGLDANYLEAWLYQGRVAVIMGQTAKAVPLFMRARAIDPRHSEVNTELAALEAAAKNWGEARQFAAEAVRADAANARAHWYLAISADQLKEFELAAREYTAYLQTVRATDGENVETVGWARTRLQQIKGRP